MFGPFFLKNHSAQVNLDQNDPENNDGEVRFWIGVAKSCARAFKWAQLKLNGLYKKKLQFSRYSTETCSILFYISRRLMWAIVEPDWTKNKDAKHFWNCKFSYVGRKIDIFHFPEKLMKFIFLNQCFLYWKIKKK